MPNKRDPKKSYLSGWIDSNLKKELAKIAKQRGITVSTLMIEYVKLGVSGDFPEPPEEDKKALARKR
jgi:hypothetical protein